MWPRKKGEKKTTQSWEKERERVESVRLRNRYIYTHICLWTEHSNGRGLSFSHFSDVDRSRQPVRREVSLSIQQFKQCRIKWIVWIKKKREEDDKNKNKNSIGQVAGVRVLISHSVATNRELFECLFPIQIVPNSFALSLRPISVRWWMKMAGVYHFDCALCTNMYLN